MVTLNLKVPENFTYPEFRDSICKSLVGNRGFIENDIIVSDCNEAENEVCIILGDDTNTHTIEIDCDCKVTGESN